MKEDYTPAGCIFAIVWFPLLIIASSIYHGFVLTKLWSWFVVPVFSAPHLSIPAAIGLCLIVGFMSKDNDSSNHEKKPLWEVIFDATLKAAIVPSLSLLTGYIVSHYM
jgi:hypothetical protein